MDKDIGRIITILDKNYQSRGFESFDNWFYSELEKIPEKLRAEREEYEQSEDYKKEMVTLSKEIQRKQLKIKKKEDEDYSKLVFSFKHLDGIDREIAIFGVEVDKIAQSVGFKNHEDWENKRRDHYKSLDPNEIKRLLNFVSTTYW